MALEMSNSGSIVVSARECREEVQRAEETRHVSSVLAMDVGDEPWARRLRQASLWQSVSSLCLCSFTGRELKRVGYSSLLNHTGVSPKGRFRSSVTFSKISLVEYIRSALFENNYNRHDACSMRGER